jgi:hypothetical protein
VKDLDEALRDFEGDPVEAWHRFQPDLYMSKDITQFVLNEYRQAEKSIHIDYGNLIIMSAKLKNGYIVVEHCICMDPKEFNIDKGIEICKEKILSKLFEIYEPVEIKDLKNLKKLSIKAK